MDQISIIYTPCASREAAKDLLQRLLKAHLVACGNIIQSDSCYFWNGAPAEDEEFILICKTSLDQTEAAHTAIQKLHKYELPAILSWTVQCNAEYKVWVDDQLDA